MTNGQIMTLTCKKHIKIYKLNKNGLTNKQVADSLGTSPGYVYNVLKKYKDKPELASEADLVTGFKTV